MVPHKWGHRHTDRHTHIWINRLIESIVPEGWCFENVILWDEIFIILQSSGSALASGKEDGKSWEDEKKSLA